MRCGIEEKMNYRITVQYDGTRYRGWQKQGNTENTIQGKFEGILTKLTGTPVEVQGAGRTDAGVHASGQIANFKINTTLSDEELMEYLNRYLPEDIAVTALSRVDELFHSRLSAKRKTYMYRLGIGNSRNVFERNYIYCFDREPDLDKMQAAAKLLTGTHDFAAFTAKKIGKSTVRELYSVNIIKNKNEIRFIFCGNGFLYNMVRILTGTLIEAATGKRSVESVGELLTEADRTKAGFTAPAKGLCLVAVEYD